MYLLKYTLFVLCLNLINPSKQHKEFRAFHHKARSKNRVYCEN